MPNPRDSNYKIKPFMLDLSKPDERELYEWFQAKDRGFKQETKAHWLKKMRREKRDEVQGYSLPRDLGHD